MKTRGRCACAVPISKEQYGVGIVDYVGVAVGIVHGHEVEGEGR